MAAARRAAGASMRAMMLRRGGGANTGAGMRSSSVLAGGSSSVSSSVSSSSSLRLSSPSSSMEGLGATGGARRWMMSKAGGGGGDKKKAEAEGEAAAGAEEGKANEAGAAGAAPEDEKQKVIEKLQAENKEMKDRVLRTLAEMENVRTIARRDMEQAKQFALQSFAKQLLDVADNLSRALESVPAEALQEKKEENHLLVTLVEGVRMTDQQLQKVFGANKIVRYGAPGDKFDPNVHDALFEYEDPGKAPGCVGQVLKTGYKLNDRVIRPAQVGTVKK